MTFNSFTSKNITDELLFELSNFYRYTFNNEHGHYLVYPSDGKFISPNELFKSSSQRYVEIEKMDRGLDLTRLRRDSGEMPILYHSPVRTLNVLTKILEKNGFVSTMRNSQQTLVGVAFGYIGSLSAIFRNEYQNSFQFSDDLRAINNKSGKGLFQELYEEFNIKEYDKLFSLSCVGIQPNMARGLRNYLQLVSGLFNLIPLEKRDGLLTIGEARPSSTAVRLQVGTDLYQVKNFLPSQDSYILVASTNQLIKRHNLDLVRFKRDLVRGIKR